MHRMRVSMLAVALVLFVLMEPNSQIGLTLAEAAGTQAPAFEVVTLGGEAYSKESLKGQPALLVFWASWCPVCRRELPVLGQFYEKERPPQLRMLSIGFSDQRGNIERYIKAHPDAFVFPSAFDEDNWVAQAFKITATPSIVLLDAQGNIVLVHRGAGVLDNPKFKEFLASIKS